MMRAAISVMLAIGFAAPPQLAAALTDLVVGYFSMTGSYRPCGWLHFTAWRRTPMQLVHISTA